MPAGLWAVASGLRGPGEAAAWARGAAAAAAWTFRRPRGGDREALAALRLLRRRAPWLAVHGRWDLALLAGAEAWIRSAGSLEPPADRELLRGASVHDEAEAAAALEAGALFLIYGPVFPTPSKAGILEARGVQALAALTASSPVPVIAIGGFTGEEELRQARAAGAHGVAVLRAAREPERLGRLARAWEEAQPSS